MNNKIYKIKTQIKRIPKGLYNLYYFFWVIWNYEVWDYQYNLDIFKRTFPRTRDCLKNGITKSGKEDAENIDRFLELIEEKDLREVSPEYKYLKKNYNVYNNGTNKLFKIIGGFEKTLSKPTLPVGKRPRYNQLVKREITWNKARWNRGWNILRDEIQGWWE